MQILERLGRKGDVGHSKTEMTTRRIDLETIGGSGGGCAAVSCTLYAGRVQHGTGEACYTQMMMAAEQAIVAARGSKCRRSALLRRIPCNVCPRCAVVTG